MAEPLYVLDLARNDETSNNNESMEWSCTCIICKLLARPIFKKFAKEKSKEVSNKEEEVEESVPAVTQNVLGSVANNVRENEQNNIKKETSIDMEAIASRIVEEFNKKFSVKINDIEKELINTKKEFNTAIEEFKNAIIEIRTAVSEIANPFNFMRKYAEIVDDSGKLLQLLTQQQNTQQQAQQVSPQLLTPIIAQLPTSEEIKTLLSSIVSTQALQKPSHFARILRLIKWVDENLIGFPKEIIDGFLSFATESGLVSEKEKNLLISAIKFVEEMRRRGISIREQLIMFYTIVKMLGIEDREADNEILKIIVEESKRNQSGV